MMKLLRLQAWIIVILLSLALAAACTAPPETEQEVSLATTPAATGVATPVAATATATPIPPTATIFRIPTLIPTPTTTGTVTPTPSATPPGRAVAPAPGIWLSVEELAALPREGAAWERLLETADGPLDEPNMAGASANHDVQTLGVALVYARTGSETYRAKAAEAIRSAIGTEYTGRQDEPDGEIGALALTVGRNLVSYVIAADLIALQEYDAPLDAAFRTWIEGLLHEQWPDGSLVSEDEKRANNRGRMAGASRAAIAVYLGDEEELLRTAMVFKGFLGDRDMYRGFNFDSDLSWQADWFRPLGINRAGAILNGFSIDGALPEEMRRGCSFQIPPCYTSYPWGALQGIVVEANILHRQGFDVWNWQDQAILRAVEYLHYLQQTYEEQPWWAHGDDAWVPWLINDVYGANFPTTEVRMGKNMGWTDWTHWPVPR